MHSFFSPYIEGTEKKKVWIFLGKTWLLLLFSWMLLYNMCRKDTGLRKRESKGGGGIMGENRGAGGDVAPCDRVTDARVWGQGFSENYWLKEALGAEGNTSFRSHSEGEAELEDANGYGRWQPMENRFCQTSLISLFEESLTERLLKKCSIEQLCYVAMQAAWPLESTISPQYW